MTKKYYSCWTSHFGSLEVGECFRYNSQEWVKYSKDSARQLTEDISIIYFFDEYIRVHEEEEEEKDDV